MGNIKYSPQNKMRRGIPQRSKKAWGKDGNGRALCLDSVYLRAGALFTGVGGVGAWLQDDFPPSARNPAAPHCSPLPAVFAEQLFVGYTRRDSPAAVPGLRWGRVVKAETFLPLPWFCR